MINKTKVFKIKYISLHENDCLGQISWINGCSIIPKTGGSGKTFTSKKIVNRMFSDLKSLPSYGVSFRCEIVSFELNIIGNSCEAL